ncbi:MAG: DUF721 domain-containing protein [Bacteroidaceae bacterium]|nr:DUF721 domain-containing protein [Bacteroidaceae bacterium]
MKRNNTETITDVVYQVLRQSGLEMPLNEYRLIQAWNQVLGKTISRYTQDLKIHNMVLYATISSAPLRNELQMRRSYLVEALNNHVGAQVISQIVLK